MQTKIIVIANINEQRISLAKIIKNIAYSFRDFLINIQVYCVARWTPTELAFPYREAKRF